MLAAMSAQAQTVKALLAHGAEPTTLDDKGRNAFHLACFSWNPAVPHLLVTHLPSILASMDREGRNGLYYAATNPHEDRRLQILELILRSKCDPNHTDCYGWTPLWYASRGDSPEVVNMLVVYRADPGCCALDSSQHTSSKDSVMFAGSKESRLLEQQITQRPDLTMLPSPELKRAAGATGEETSTAPDWARTAALELAEARTTAARYAARCAELEAKLAGRDHGGQVQQAATGVGQS
uniref:Uncharacterized protein n=1 Tax=Alexandrium monilatum TaxID=311494 RepID=A0A7S4PW66_9DINO